MYWFIKCLKQYGDFHTRARRCEYWNFVFWLWVLLTVISCFIPDIRLLPTTLLHLDFDSISISKLGTIPFVIVALMICPYFAVATRRLHDINKSAWWLLILLIPFIGGIWFFILMVIPGDHFDNKWGRNPKIIKID